MGTSRSCRRARLAGVTRWLRDRNQIARTGPGRKQCSTARLIGASTGSRNCAGWLKEARSVATRFEKLAITTSASSKLGMIRKLLRRLQTTSSQLEVRLEVGSRDFVRLGAIASDLSGVGLRKRGFKPIRI